MGGYPSVAYSQPLVCPSDCDQQTWQQILALYDRLDANGDHAIENKELQTIAKLQNLKISCFVIFVFANSKSGPRGAIRVGNKTLCFANAIVTHASDPRPPNIACRRCWKWWNGTHQTSGGGVLEARQPPQRGEKPQPHQATPDIGGGGAPEQRQPTLPVHNPRLSNGTQKKYNPRWNPVKHWVRVHLASYATPGKLTPAR